MRPPRHRTPGENAGRRRAASPPLVAALVVLLGACGGGDAGGGGSTPDPDRQRYEADKARCDSIAGGIEAAQKSCMTYRGWPEGKYRR